MFQLREPLINTKIRLIDTVHLPDKILPAGSVFTVKWGNEKGCYLEDEKGKALFDYFCVANFQLI